MTLKQATNLLIKCDHDFRVFVGEILFVKNGQICMKNLGTKVFDPGFGLNAPLNTDSSQALMSDPSKRSMDRGAQSIGVSPGVQSQDAIKVER